MHWHSLSERLQAFVDRIRAETHVPGIAIAVSYAGERAYACSGSAANGAPLTPQHRFHLGCGTKLLLAAVTLQLAERGMLPLDTRIGSVLPELRASAHGAVHVAHLLAHTSGYRGLDISDPATRVLAWTGLVERVACAAQLFPPGSVFSYEHSESVLLAEVLRRVSGCHALALVRDLVLDPLEIVPGRLASDAGSAHYAGRHELDIQSARFAPIRDALDVPPLWLPAFSDFTISMIDLATIGEALGGRVAVGGGSAAVLSGSALDLLHRPVVTLPPSIGGPLSELLPVAFGLGAACVRGGFSGSSGITHGQCLGLRVDRTAQLVVAVGLNAMVPYLRDLILATVCRELTGRRPSSERTPFGFALDELPGTYLGPGNAVVDVAYAADRLTCDIGREHAPERLRVELALDDDGRPALRTPLPQLSLAFFRDHASAALGLMIGLHAHRRID